MTTPVLRLGVARAGIAVIPPRRATVARTIRLIPWGISAIIGAPSDALRVAIPTVASLGIPTVLAAWLPGRRTPQEGGLVAHRPTIRAAGAVERSDATTSASASLSTPNRAIDNWPIRC
ncbi:hypothetical protein [Williamsia sterculiae]|uniref:hypothetical protein n=1 Tax=Williamsia sterculiae TaxID=1344003 RepID=UPI00118022B1|nr:hypothetical protein [Williamsia sterculiae]